PERDGEGHEEHQADDHPLNAHGVVRRVNVKALSTTWPSTDRMRYRTVWVPGDRGRRLTETVFGSSIVTWASSRSPWVPSAVPPGLAGELALDGLRTLTGSGGGEASGGGTPGGRRPRVRRRPEQREPRKRRFGGGQTARNEDRRVGRRRGVVRRGEEAAPGSVVLVEEVVDE